MNKTIKHSSSFFLTGPHALVFKTSTSPPNFSPAFLLLIHDLLHCLILLFALLIYPYPLLFPRFPHSAILCYTFLCVGRVVELLSDFLWTQKVKSFCQNKLIHYHSFNYFITMTQIMYPYHLFAPDLHIHLCNYL